MDILDKIDNVLNEQIEEFDEVTHKATKKLYKVVEIETKGGARVYTLRPLEKGKNTSENEFKVDTKTITKEYVAA